MAIYQPYFYIIQDKRNGIYYAGAKWAKDANPSTFMIEDGYQTSSETIRALIRKHGIDNFTVIRVRTFETADEAYDYETRFLKKVKAKNNPKFYNGHNNDGKLDHRKMKAVIQETYGVDFAFQSMAIKDKIKNTHLKKRGVENPFQSEDVKKKRKQRILEKYGVEEFFHADEVKQMTRKSMQERHGVDYPMQSEKIRAKYKNTIQEKYNVSHPSQAEFVKAKVKEKADYLLSRPQLEQIRVYQKKYNLKFGQGWVRKSDEFIDSLLASLVEKHGEI